MTLTVVIVGILPECLAPARSIASTRIVAAGMLFYNEDNSNYTPLLSGQQNGTYNMPIITETVSVTTVEGTDPSPGEEVHFAADQPSKIVESITFGSAYTTDGNGQFTFTVYGNASVGTVYITPYWFRNGALFRTAQIKIDLISEAQSTSMCPIGSWGTILAYSPLIYHDSTVITSGIGWISKTHWSTYLPHIVWQQTGPGEKINSSEACFDDQTYASTSVSSFPRSIVFRKPHFKEDPWNVTCYSSYCPSFVRHPGQFQCIADHELGHALGLAHNMTN